MHLIEDHAEKAEIPVRFAASKLAEGDSLILDLLNLDENEKDALEHIVKPVSYTHLDVYKRQLFKRRIGL